MLKKKSLLVLLIIMLLTIVSGCGSVTTDMSKSEIVADNYSKSYEREV
ncbi:MAG: hypothetical protein GX790_01790 [Syntrophomonadaceae bacterium]|nr:hypothetical protein [Syntrophomonadaceae bacterium]